ncbi:MAG TPA: hypothetical protein VKR42_03640 [Ktedonobacteraceae bacterium]|nr:hypothetical protein [Ktedonobacteraceae bacterium]
METLRFGWHSELQSFSNLVTAIEHGKVSDGGVMDAAHRCYA